MIPTKIYKIITFLTHEECRVNGKTYVKIDRFAIRSLLFPVLADISMVKLEQKVVPKEFIWNFGKCAFTIPYVLLKKGQLNIFYQ